MSRKRTRDPFEIPRFREVRSRRVRPRSAQPTRAITVVPRVFGNARSMTERKYFDISGGGPVVSVNSGWTGAELDPTGGTLFCPTEGNDIDERVGRKVTIVGLKIRAWMSVAPYQGDEFVPITTRFVLYQDTQTNGVQSQAEELIASAGVGTNQFQSTANFGRFRVLKDKTIVLGSNTPITLLSTGPPVYFGTGQRRAFKVNVRFKRPVVVRFNATNGGSIADIVDNSFHVIAGKSTSSRTVTLAYSSRIVYLDR